MKTFLAEILKRLSLGIVLAALAFYAFWQIAYEMFRGKTFQLDKAVNQYFQAHQVPVVHEIMICFSWLAGPIGLPITITLFFIFWMTQERTRPQAYSLLLAALGGAALLTGLKELFHRPRPTDLFVAHMKHPGFSFPSGHSFFSMTIYGLLAYWLTRKMRLRNQGAIWTVALVLVFLVGFSRVFLGAHYPSDVAGGFALAVPWLWGCLQLPILLHRRQERLQRQ